MLNFHPKKGTIVCCDFSKGFQPPEMVKVRPVVIITPQLPGRPRLCTIVPLSTVKPNPQQLYHHKMSNNSLPSKLQKADCWAKCDMLYTVCLQRLDRIRERDNHGNRRYVTSKITAQDLYSIEQAVINGIGLKKFLM